MNNKALLILILFFGPIGCTVIGFAGVYSYSAEPIEAWVVDAKTQQPIEGVVVVAHWVLEGGLHWDQVGELMILETVTDQDGRFAFPAWGPKVAIKGVLTFLDPELLFFKPGYKYRRLANQMEFTKKPPVRKSIWNGKTIELKPFEGSLEAYVKKFKDLNYHLDFVVDDPKKCDWKKIPRTLVAMGREQRRLEEKGVQIRYVSTIDEELFSNDEYYVKKAGRQCGSPKAFLRSLRQ